MNLSRSPESPADTPPRFPDLKEWKLEKDQMTCRTCGITVLPVGENPSPSHLESCPLHNQSFINPWTQLLQALQTQGPRKKWLSTTPELARTLGCLDD